MGGDGRGDLADHEDVETVDEADQPAYQQHRQLRPPDRLAIDEFLDIETGHARRSSPSAGYGPACAAGVAQRR